MLRSCSSSLLSLQNSKNPSASAVTNDSPSFITARAQILLLWASSVFTASPVDKSHSITRPSAPVLISCLFLLMNEHRCTAFVCPSNVFTTAYVSKDQILIVLSPEHVAKSLSYWQNATSHNPRLWLAKVAKNSPSSRFHTLHVLS